jgi:DNA replication and repair protein RecF
MESYLCSAGEQKILLSGVFLSFVINMLQTNNRKLILLLDDVVAHLDAIHRKSLFKYLKDIISRNKKAICVWLSGTDKNLFEEFRNEALFLKIQNNSIERD